MAPKRPSSPGPAANGSKVATTSSNRERRTGAGEDGLDERGEFEDAWEDEYEEEDVLSNDDEDEEDEDMMEDGVDGVIRGGKSAETGMEKDVNAMDIEAGKEQEEDEPVPYLPGLGQGNKELAEGEQLVADMSTYHFLHHARLTWPCLSFDILRDNEGEQRQRPPHNACIVAGTQADASGGPSTSNEVAVMRFEGMSKTKGRKNEGDDSDDEDESDSDSEDGNAGDDDATLSYRSIPHNGGVNRIRAQQMPMPYSTPAPEPPNGNYFVATFSETGKVHIFDIATHLHSLQNPKSFGGVETLNNKPVYTVESHKRAEGFALAWSAPIPSSNATRLLSGDIHSKIYMTNLTPSGFQVSSGAPFASHTSSIEDIQWSPSESTVFGSVSADRSLRIWDIRVRDRKSVVAATAAHESDINVMSWNALTSYLVVTGGDEGGLKVWDLRNMKSGSKGSSKSSAEPVASFNWHQSPITSVEWHPTEDSIFGASSADDSVTLWDLAVERDEDEGPVNSGGAQQDRTKDVPPQLLFVHQGQKEIKEIHWHPQIPGAMISTSLDNFAIFKTISV